MNVQIHPRFMLLLILTSFSEVNSAPAAGTGLADAWTVKGMLKRLFSFSQRRAKGRLQWHSTCFLSSSRVAAWSRCWWDPIWSSSIQLSLLGLYN